LIPSIEGESVLGQIWDSSIFPVTGQTKVTTMVRGDCPLGLATSAMKRHLGVDALFDAAHLTEALIPQYDLYHNERVDLFEAEVKKKFEGKVLLSGNYFQGASVEACVSRSLKLMPFC
jgi:protoporphyrinogen oxidase